MRGDRHIHTLWEGEKIAQWVEALASEPGDLSLISRTSGRWKEKRDLSCLLGPHVSTSIIHGQEKNLRHTPTYMDRNKQEAMFIEKSKKGSWEWGRLGFCQC